MFGNPFDTAEKFREILTILFETHGTFDMPCTPGEFFKMVEIKNRLDELRGKQLACWCSLEKDCHADVLAEFANYE